MEPELDYLCLAAHPDDAELWCGGTLLKMRQAGRAVGILDFTRGEAATHGSVAERERETAAANALLQPTWRGNLGLPDGGLSDNDEARRLVVETIRRHRVKVLIAPWFPNRHPDHNAVHQIARSAMFFSGAGGYPCPLPPWRPWRLMFHLEQHDAKPSFVIDISAQFEDRMKLVECYGSQFYTGKGPAKNTTVGSAQFDHKMRARFAHYGAQIGCDYGEPYIVEETLRLDDPLANSRNG